VQAQESTIRAMRAVPLLSGLSEADIGRVLGVGQEKEFRAGDPIVEEGDQACDFYLLLRGQARLNVPGRGETTLATGDHFGEMAVLDGEPRSASIRAETDVTALRIGRESFLGLLNAHGSIGRKLLVEMSKRVRQAERGPA
jgi:CRP/FNR family cyclic AMP-dependent transcriptional regulator